MDAGDRGSLISVNKGLLRHPAVVGAGVAALVALLALNGLAFVRGLGSPWLLGGVILADMLVSEENHLDWLETQLTTIEQIGLPNYLAQQLS